MANLNGIHHLAITMSDVKSQTAFLSDVLGMKANALYWMAGARGYWRAGIGLNVHCSLALVTAATLKDITTEFGMVHAGVAWHGGN